MMNEAVRLDDTETTESGSGVRVRREAEGAAWAKSWFQNMPDPWRTQYEKLKARRIADSTK